MRRVSGLERAESGRSRPVSEAARRERSEDPCVYVNLT